VYMRLSLHCASLASIPNAPETLPGATSDSSDATVDDIWRSATGATQGRQLLSLIEWVGGPRSLLAREEVDTRGSLV